MSDIEKAVTYLHDNIPTWFKGIAQIEEKVTRMQDEISRVPVARAPAKRRTGSVESTRDLDTVMEDSNTTPQTVLATRKRKTASVLSERASTPVKYRSRQMIVVVYDGEIQQSFETLVRSIGTGRNMLRKGKMQAQLDAMAAIAGSDDDDDDDDADDAAISKIRYRHRANFSSMRGRGPMRNMRTMRGLETNANAVVPPEEFDFADKALELAQGLCEKAAHQSLRDGECRKELDGVRRHCEDVLDKAKNAVERFAARKEKDAQEQGTSQESPKRDLSSLTTHEITMLPPPTRNEPKLVAPQARSTPGTSFTMPKPTDMEIDVDDGDDDSFVMPPIRMTSRI
ncbi:hypothetical protein P154DRAFT_365679 [Amniculicola lignicola CBS 123094]|uniref:Uncharacterized protein n=1 Tax=Amniculicola lignicola CBS 123094 TaxID=1392246 RepID=A0A6A5VZ52_9PLEO|nr:hypothetical protein P154DRAFT_365679 [Amniculicola lignicola CBS 123094]